MGFRPVRLDGPTQRDLTDRFTGIRGDIELRPGGTEEQKRGNELSEHRTTGAEQWEQRNDQTNPISRNQLAINGLRNPRRLLEARLGECSVQVAFALQTNEIGGYRAFPVHNYDGRQRRGLILAGNLVTLVNQRRKAVALLLHK